MLDNYLSGSKSNFAGKQIIHIVIGNEAADIDSIVSSIVYAFFKETINPKKESEIFMPVINIPKDDLRLRNEIIYLFSQTKINIKNLIFLDQIDFKHLAEQKKLKLILVDHNKISHKQEFLSDYIEEVIDHHEDEKSYNNIIKTIEKTGSTATLVGEKIIQRNSALLDKEIAILLSGAISIDTSNLSQKSGKTTQKDEKILNYLISEYEIDKNELFEKLSREKRNISNLSSRDILRKDYKEWIMGREKTGFSSVNLPLQSWLEKDSGLFEEINKYYVENSLDILFIMIAYTNREFKRELIIFGNDESLLDDIYFYLQKSGGRLSPVDIKTDDKKDVDKKKIRFYSLGETLWSRKKLQPVLKSFFANQNN